MEFIFSLRGQDRYQSKHFSSSENEGKDLEVKTET